MHMDGKEDEVVWPKREWTEVVAGGKWLARNRPPLRLTVAGPEACCMSLRQALISELYQRDATVLTVGLIFAFPFSFLIHFNALQLKPGKALPQFSSL